jgi:hypothetical protein
MLGMDNNNLPQARHLLKRLENEWNQLCNRHARLGSSCQWNLPGTQPASLAEALARTGYRPDKRTAATQPALPPCPVDDESVDAALIQLLIAAKTDQLAARVILQRLLPGLVTIARRKSYSFAHRIDVLDDLVANAWGIILKYPVERRPRRVLANLLCDTSFETFVRPQRLRSSSEVPRSHDMFEDHIKEQHQDPLHELVEVLIEARTHGVAESDIDFLCRLVTHGRPEVMAVEMNVTARTVRNHREAILHRVRQAVAA